MKAVWVLSMVLLLCLAVQAQVKVRRSDYGGTPNATPEQLTGAFEKAFAVLKKAGGGELIVGKGNYSFGDLTGSAAAVQTNDLKNAAISGYGARFRMRTTGSTPPNMPTFFRFVNPENVTIKGLSFADA